MVPDPLREPIKVFRICQVTKVLRLSTIIDSSCLLILLRLSSNLQANILLARSLSTERLVLVVKPVVCLRNKLREYDLHQMKNKEVKKDLTKKQLRMKGLDWRRKLKKMTNAERLKLRKIGLHNKHFKFKSDRKSNWHRLSKSGLFKRQSR